MTECKENWISEILEERWWRLTLWFSGSINISLGHVARRSAARMKHSILCCSLIILISLSNPFQPIAAIWKDAHHSKQRLTPSHHIVDVSKPRNDDMICCLWCDLLLEPGTFKISETLDWTTAEDWHLGIVWFISRENLVSACLAASFSHLLVH